MTFYYEFSVRGARLTRARKVDLRGGPGQNKRKKAKPAAAHVTADATLAFEFGISISLYYATTGYVGTIESTAERECRAAHTRGPEADETKTMTVEWHGHTTRACHCQSGGSTVQRVRPVRMHSACAPRHSAPTYSVHVQGQLCRRALHARADGRDAADHLLCEGAVCTRVCDRVHLRRCHAAPKRCGSELEL